MSDQTNSGDLYDLDELLGAYALDAVSDTERDRIDDYLTVNPRAAAEVAEHREIAAMLAFTGMDAPDGVWERIEATLDDTVPAPSGPLASLLGGAAAPADASAAAIPESAPTPLATPAPLGVSTQPPPTQLDELAAARARRERRRSVLPWVAAAAAAAVAVVSLGLADRAGAPTSPLVEAVDIARADRDSITTTLVASNSSATADAVIDQDGHGYLDARGLPTLAQGQTYQLWGVMADTGDVISLGVLGPNPELEPFTVEGAVAALAVTIEAAPGVISDGNPDGAFVGEF